MRGPLLFLDDRAAVLPLYFKVGEVPCLAHVIVCLGIEEICLTLAVSEYMGVARLAIIP
jgi:hypothetical protein